MVSGSRSKLEVYELFFFKFVSALMLLVALLRARDEAFKFESVDLLCSLLFSLGLRVEWACSSECCVLPSVCAVMSETWRSLEVCAALDKLS